MAKHQEIKQDSPFWKPESPGDKLTGLFNGFSETENGLAIKIGTKLMGYSTVLRSFLDKYLMKLKEGKSKLQVVYIKSIPAKKKGRSDTRIYTVELDGKMLEQESIFKTLSGKEAALILKKQDDKRKK